MVLRGRAVQSARPLKTVKWEDAEMKVLETERLFLREMNMEDFDALYAVLADSEIMQHYPYSFDEKRVRDWAFANTDYPSIYSYCKYTNEPSYKTAESIGMHFVWIPPSVTHTSATVSSIVSI